MYTLSAVNQQSSPTFLPCPLAVFPIVLWGEKLSLAFPSDIVWTPNLL